FFQAEDGIRDKLVTGVQTCALPICVAFAAFALSVVGMSNVAQLIVGRIGVRPTLTAGLVAFAASVAWLMRLPVDGHYFWDLFPRSEERRVGKECRSRCSSERENRM